MTKTLPAPRTQAVVHVACWLDRFASRRLELVCDVAVEAHLWSCDACFAAYVALVVSRG